MEMNNTINEKASMSIAGNNSIFRNKNKPGQDANVNPKEQLIKLCNKFLITSSSKYSELELEAKFGTKGIKNISRQDFFKNTT